MAGVLAVARKAGRANLSVYPGLRRLQRKFRPAAAATGSVLANATGWQLRLTGASPLRR